MIGRTTIAVTLVAVAGTVIAAGCALGLRGPLPPVTSDGLRESDAYMAKAGFQVMPDPANPSQPAAFNRLRRVYVIGAGRNAPKVILLHELPGLRDGDIHLGALLGVSFEVYMPLMFGTAGQDDSGRGNRQACKTDLFKCNDRNTRHPIAEDLLAMTNRICGDRECGVIGMCLTGSVPLSLLHANNVVALVLAQPTLPAIWHIWPFRALDISEEDTAAAMRIEEQRRASIYMVRYRHDWISGHGAFNRLRDRIMPSKEKLSLFDAKEVDGRSHSTLVEDDKYPEVAKEQLVAVVTALNARLRPH
jgi:dienelactone hydrolase